MNIYELDLSKYTPEYNNHPKKKVVVTQVTKPDPVVYKPVEQIIVTEKVTKVDIERLKNLISKREDREAQLKESQKGYDIGNKIITKEKSIKNKRVDKPKDVYGVDVLYIRIPKEEEEFEKSYVSKPKITEVKPKKVEVKVVEEKAKSDIEIISAINKLGSHEIIFKYSGRLYKWVDGCICNSIEGTIPLCIKIANILTTIDFINIS